MFRIFSPNYSTGEPRNCYSTFIRSASGYPVQRKSGNASFNFCYSCGLRPLARADCCNSHYRQLLLPGTTGASLVWPIPHQAIIKTI